MEQEQQHFFLQKFLPFEVLTVACVGGSEYLKKQFLYLDEDETNHPTILQMPKKNIILENFIRSFMKFIMK